MSDLADALEAYEHAIATGAPSTIQSAALVDLIAAHLDRMDHLHEAEEAVTQSWGRLLSCLDAPDKHIYLPWGDPVGGYVCSVCDTPVESEPCEQHQPVAYARCNA